MDFTVEDELASIRDRARAWAEATLNPEWVQEQRRTGSHHAPELHTILAAQGWLGAGWPAELGGTSNDPALTRAIFHQIGRHGISLDAWITTTMVCRTILQTGSASLQKEIIGAAISGRVLIALGYSEPGSGSDAAAATTRAVPDGAYWIVNGQKMFTSIAEHASHVFLLTRTDPSAPKHRGLTMFLVSTQAPGYECRSIDTLGGVRTNATFYTDVPVPDAMRVGHVNGGWDVMRVALVYERSGEIPGNSGGNLEMEGSALDQRVATWCAGQLDSAGRPRLMEPSVRERLARIAIDREVSRLLSLRATWATETGSLSGIEGSARKLFGTEAAQRAHWDLLDIIGPEAVLRRGADAPLDGEVEEGFRMGVVNTIRGGSSEVLRDLIAERQLGLPRYERRQASSPS